MATDGSSTGNSSSGLMDLFGSLSTEKSDTSFCTRRYGWNHQLRQVHQRWAVDLGVTKHLLDWFKVEQGEISTSSWNVHEWLRWINTLEESISTDVLGSWRRVLFAFTAVLRRRREQAFPVKSFLYCAWIPLRRSGDKTLSKSSPPRLSNLMYRLQRYRLQWSRGTSKVPPPKSQ
jgi:hypothetical protein